MVWLSGTLLLIILHCWDIWGRYVTSVHIVEFQKRPNWIILQSVCVEVRDERLISFTRSDFKGLLLWAQRICYYSVIFYVSSHRLTSLTCLAISSVALWYYHLRATKWGFHRTGLSPPPPSTAWYQYRSNPWFCIVLQQQFRNNRDFANKDWNVNVNANIPAENLRGDVGTRRLDFARRGYMLATSSILCLKPNEE